MELQHWQYSFVLHTCRLGERVHKATNPFTGDVIEVPIDRGMTASDRDGMRAVFASYGVKGPEADFEGYTLYLPGSGSVRFRGGDLEQVKPPLTSFSVEVVVQKLSDDALKLVLDVARQGNLMFMSSSGEQVRLTTESNNPKIKGRWPDASVIETTDALKSWLESEIGGRKVDVSHFR